MTKTFVRVFTIVDFEEEEIWLREQSKKGWKLVKMVPPFLYTFEQCEPEDVIYRLDFKNGDKPADYMQMMEDFGWEYFGECLGRLYFRKPASEIQSEEDGELFSDAVSKIDQLSKIVRTRMMPMICIFLCAVVPNALRYLDGEYVGPWGQAFGFIFGLLFGLYMVMFIYFAVKLKKLRNRYREN